MVKSQERHKVYGSIVNAIKAGKLIEPFTAKDCIQNCCNLYKPPISKSTYPTFLPKHEEDNPGNNSKLFKRHSRGKYKCLRPFKYGF